MWRNILSKLTSGIVWILSECFHICGPELHFSERCCEYAMRLQWLCTSTFKWVTSPTSFCYIHDIVFNCHSHIVESCPLTKLNGGLSRLHSADEDAVSWLTNYGKWHAYEKKKKWFKWKMRSEGTGPQLWALNRWLWAPERFYEVWRVGTLDLNKWRCRNCVALRPMTLWSLELVAFKISFYCIQSYSMLGQVSQTDIVFVVKPALLK